MGLKGSKKPFHSHINFGLQDFTVGIPVMFRGGLACAIHSPTAPEMSGNSVSVIMDCLQW